MEIKINMLNVKDGDAIIVELIKPTDVLVMVIDGGEEKYYASKVKPKLVEILNIHNKTAPDIVVCTHYDSDHIAGLIPLVQDYITDIKQVWIHSPSPILNGLFNEVNNLNNKSLSLLKSLNEVILEKFLLHESNTSKEEVEMQKSFVLESLNQLNQLINIIPNEKLKEVFHNDVPLNNWPEIKILGPTRDYFNSLFPRRQTLKSLILEELETNNFIDQKGLLLENLEIINPCDKLKSDATAKITAINKASIIIAIDDVNKRYLFTGDAGIESFKKIPNWENELKNLYFLKVPHHGSNNNMTKEIAELMNPEFAFSSGDTHQDEEVIECLALKTKDKVVKTTKSNGDLVYTNQN
jgi:beta-lactamase superfamily II metal-dependent hydrolase